jgi:hypothetical protein
MSIRRTTVGLVSTAAAWLASGVFAQAPEQASTPQAAAPEGVEEMVVRGRRMSDVGNELRIFVRSFIDEVVAVPPGRGYARWHQRVCVGVYNLENDAAQYVVDRISQLARDVGLDAGEPGCTPEVIVIFTTTAKDVAAHMVAESPRMFRPAGGIGEMNLDRAALDEFATSDRPVRWWHVSLPVDARTGNTAIRQAGEGPPTVNVAGPSRIHDGTRDDLKYVIIIVDATQLTGTTWQELGDYLAVVSLAQIAPDTNPTAFDSILNLFSNPAAYTGLTDWDRSYVRALYEFDQERRPVAQTGDLVSRMARQELEPETEQ